jgi:hypothetical protein
MQLQGPYRRHRPRSRLATGPTQERTLGQIREASEAPEYRKLETGDLQGANAGLEKKHAWRAKQLNKRLAKMAAVLEEVTPQIRRPGDTG